MSRVAGLRRERPATLPPMAWHDTEVVAIREVAAGMVRVTLGAATIRGFETAGPDEHCKLVLPQQGERLPSFDPAGNVFEQWRAIPAPARPHLRTYTVRAARPEAGELDLDFALHRPGGPAMRWLDEARSGSPLAIYGARGEFDPPAGADWLLLLADPAGVPALASILESLPRDATAVVVAEHAPSGVAVDLDLGPAASAAWVRRAPDAAPFDALRARLAGIDLPPGTPYVWAAGEAAALGRLRGDLRARGIPAGRLDLVGYWLVGGVADPE